MNRPNRASQFISGGRLAGVHTSSAFGGNPAEQMTKAAGAGPSGTTGGIDPHGDSWLSIQHSLQQCAHPEFMQLEADVRSQLPKSDDSRITSEPI